MRRSAARLIPPALLLVLISCTHQVPVALRPEYKTAVARSAELAAVQPTLSFGRGFYADRRPDTTMLATFKQGANTYHLFGQRPIADALYEGLMVLVTSAGHRWLPPDSGLPDLRLDLQLLSLQAARNAGFINVGATSSIQFKLDVVDARTGQQVYSNIYNGTDQRSQAMLGLMSMVRESIDASIVNSINSVGADAKFAAAIHGRRAG